MSHDEVTLSEEDFSALEQQLKVFFDKLVMVNQTSLTTEQRRPLVVLKRKLQQVANNISHKGL